MVNEWIKNAQVVSTSVLTADTMKLIDRTTGKNSMSTASDYERAEVVRRLQDLAALVLEYIRANEAADGASYEDVFHCLYGYRFAQ